MEVKGKRTGGKGKGRQVLVRLGEGCFLALRVGVDAPANVLCTILTSSLPHRLPASLVFAALSVVFV